MQITTILQTGTDYSASPFDRAEVLSVILTEVDCIECGRRGVGWIVILHEVATDMLRVASRGSAPGEELNASRASETARQNLK